MGIPIKNNSYHRKTKQVIMVVIVSLIFILTVVIILRFLGTGIRESKDLIEKSNSTTSFDESNQLNMDIKLNQKASRNQTYASEDFLNLTDPKVCIQQWREDFMPMEDVLYCLDRYMEYLKYKNSSS